MAMSFALFTSSYFDGARADPPGTCANLQNYAFTANTVFGPQQYTISACDADCRVLRLLIRLN